MPCFINSFIIPISILNIPYTSFNAYVLVFNLYLANCTSFWYYNMRSSRSSIRLSLLLASNNSYLSSAFSRSRDSISLICSSQDIYFRFSVRGTYANLFLDRLLLLRVLFMLLLLWLLGPYLVLSFMPYPPLIVE